MNLDVILRHLSVIPANILNLRQILMTFYSEDSLLNPASATLQPSALADQPRSAAQAHTPYPSLQPGGPSSLLHLTASSAGRLGLSPGPASQDAAVHFLLLLLQLPGSPRATTALGSEAQPSGARSPRVTLPEPVIPTPQRWHSAG